MRIALLLTATFFHTLLAAQWVRDEGLPDTEMPSIHSHGERLIVGGVNTVYEQATLSAPWLNWGTITNDPVYVDAVAPFNGDLFAGTGGSHMFRASTADTWTASPGISGMGSSFISCIIAFQDTLYCGTSGGGTFRLVNGTWQSFGMLSDDQANNVYFLRVIGDTLWCGAGGNGYLFRITAGDTDWTPVPVDVVTGLSIEFTDLITAPGALVAGGTMGVYRSTDDGASWTWMAGPASVVKFTWWNDVLIASRTGATTRWFRSDNAGVSWNVFDETMLSFGHAVHNGRFYSAQLDGLWYMEQLPTAIDAPEQLSFDLYPNPTSGELTLRMPDHTAAYYSITDPLGRTVRQGRITAPVVRLDIQALASGSYLLYLNTEAGHGARRFAVH